MTRTRYEFSSSWYFAAPSTTLFDVLAALPEYPGWWPEVRTVTRIDASTFRVVVRSVLPYSLVFDVRRQTVDPRIGLIEATMSGDLIGTTRWELRAARDGTDVVFSERATIGKPVLKHLDRVLSPAFRWNHRAMMRSCKRGLHAALTGARGTCRSS